MVLGEQLLSLGEDCQLLVWRIGKYDEPEVHCATLLPSHHARDHHLLTQQAACLPVGFCMLMLVLRAVQVLLSTM